MRKKHRLKFLKPKKLLFIILVIGFLVSLALSFMEFFQDYSFITYIFEAGNVFFLLQFIFHKLDNISIHSDARRWSLKILSVIIGFLGVYLMLHGIIYYAFATFSVLSTVIFLFFEYLGFGLLLMDSYLFFKFKRRTGIIIYRG